MPAHELVWRVMSDIRQHERDAGSRVRDMRARGATRFHFGVERVVGDLLHARAGTNATGRLYRPLGKDDFQDAPVKYDTFHRVLDGLKALGLVGHRKGRSRSRDTGFGFRQTIPGRAARFWATPRLLQLAAEHGINSSNVGEHFPPELPEHPLVVRDWSTRQGRERQQGRFIKYTRTAETDRIEQDVKELNEFLVRFTLTGGRHEAYYRTFTFNNGEYNKGGRLSSIGEGSYQQHSKAERLQMTINGEPVAEIDIRASQLTIFHAMVGEPLDGRSDPYARVGIDRDVAKRWCLETLGYGRPKARWSAKAIKLWQAKGEELPKMRVVSAAMLDAFPALKRLRMGHWADLQFKEAEATIGTMLALMRQHGVPAYGIHDSVVVPRWAWELASDTLSQQFHKVTGVTPQLRVEPDPASWRTDL
jgi:hypothetical protein